MHLRHSHGRDDYGSCNYVKMVNISMEKNCFNGTQSIDPRQAIRSERAFQNTMNNIIIPTCTIFLSSAFLTREAHSIFHSGQVVIIVS